MLILYNYLFKFFQNVLFEKRKCKSKRFSLELAFAFSFNGLNIFIRQVYFNAYVPEVHLERSQTSVLEVSAELVNA